MVNIPSRSLSPPCSTISIAIFFSFFSYLLTTCQLYSALFSSETRTHLFSDYILFFSMGLRAHDEIGWCVPVAGFVFQRIHKWQASLYVCVLMCVKYSPLLHVSTAEYEALCAPQGTLRFWEYSKVSQRTYSSELETGIGRDERRACHTLPHSDSTISLSCWPCLFYVLWRTC